MGAQVQELKRQRKLLIFLCSVLVLLVFVFGIYAFVQRGIAVEMQKMAIESATRRMECDKEVMLQKRMAERARAEAQAAREEALRDFKRSSNSRDK